MSIDKQVSTKSNLHPRNKNREPYDLQAMILTSPALQTYVKPNKYGNESIDFANPDAVRALNQALIKHYYNIDYWEFPIENLVPPIPGRADYLHYIADLLADFNEKQIPLGDKVNGLDIGVGASCIYPILGVASYNWHFIGSDISDVSLTSAQNTIDKNEKLKHKISLRRQENPKNILEGIIQPGEIYDFTMSNPPFHANIEEAKKGTARKIKNLSGNKIPGSEQNFAGIQKELVYDGGEYGFIKNMVRESQAFTKQCYWFTTLISKQNNVAKVRRLLERSGTTEIRTIRMGTSNKSTRIMAWTFLSKEEQTAWAQKRWRKEGKL